MIKYDTDEEVEKTGAWLLRISEAGQAEELMYVPSELTKLGVAPIDVVDSLDWLRKQRLAAERKEIAEAAKAMSPEPPAEDGTVEEEPQTEEAPLALAYDTYGLWEWMEPIERMVEEALKIVFYEEPGLHTFNELASVSKVLLPEPPVEQRPKRRGRFSKTLPQQRVDELVSTSVGASS